MPFYRPTTETKLKQKLFNLLRYNYPSAYYRKVSDRFHAGIPDVFICHKSKSIWLELKIYPNVVTPIQNNEIERIHKAGGCAEVLSASSDGKRYWIGIKEYESLNEAVEEVLR